MYVRRLGEDGHQEWLRRRAVTEDLEAAHENIQQQVYTRIWQSVVRIVHTLDFTVEDPSQLEEDEAIGGLNDGEEGVPQGDDESETGLGEVHALVFQVSGMTGRERPVNMRDLEIFHNLVDFTKLLLSNVNPRYFQTSCYVFCEAMVKLSSRNVYISGFFKLLTAAMKSADKGGFFRGLSDNANGIAGAARGRGDDAGDGAAAGDKMEVESSANAQENLQFCLTMISKFSSEVLGRMEHCYDDMLVAMLELLLVLPKEMRNLRMQVIALKRALKQGLSFLHIASIAFDCLEEWIKDKDTYAGLQNYLCEILPLLELFLKQADDVESSFQDGKVSMDKRARQYNYKKKKKRGFKKGLTKGTAISRPEAKDLALRAVKLIGKLGTDERWLSQVRVAAQCKRVRTDADIICLRILRVSRLRKRKHLKTATALTLTRT
jgi:hypothetical protein